MPGFLRCFLSHHVQPLLAVAALANSKAEARYVNIHVIMAIMLEHKRHTVQAGSWWPTPQDLRANEIEEVPTLCGQAS